MSEIIFHGSRSDEDMIVYVRYHGEPWIKEHCYFVKYGDDIPSVIPEYENVSYLGIIYSSLTKLPKLPSKLQWLYCPINKLVSLPKLPDTLLRIDCSNNQLTELPKKLPPNLEYLYCPNNQITSIPKLPDSVKTICFERNNVSNFPNVPQNISMITCHHNKGCRNLKNNFLCVFITYFFYYI